MERNPTLFSGGGGCLVGELMDTVAWGFQSFKVVPWCHH